MQREGENCFSFSHHAPFEPATCTRSELLPPRFFGFCTTKEEKRVMHARGVAHPSFTLGVATKGRKGHDFGGKENSPIMAMLRRTGKPTAGDTVQ